MVCHSASASWENCSFECSGRERKPGEGPFAGQWRFSHNDEIATVTDSSATPQLPDRLSIDPRSPHHVPAMFEHDIGIRFNGKERFDVEEYCVSEGWVKVPAGKTLDRKGRPLLITLKGQVEAFIKPPAA